MVLLSVIRSCNRYDIFTCPQLPPVTIFWNGNLYKYLNKKDELQMSFEYSAVVLSLRALVFLFSL